MPELRGFSLFIPWLQGVFGLRPVRANCVVSHAFPALGDFAITGAKARIPWAIAGLGDWRPSGMGLPKARLAARSLTSNFQSPEFAPRLAEPLGIELLRGSANEAT
jgi:hypothetical protein